MAFRTGVLVLVMVVLGVVGGGCSETGESDGGFAIYLPASEMTIDEISAISHFELQEKPLVSIGDIISYDARTHTIELTEACYTKLDQAKLPGKPFIVCVGREPIYAGAFMAPYFSRSFDGVVIEIPSSSGTNSIHIQLGYPERPDFFSGEDPRSDSRILRSLEESSKLR